MDYLIIRYNDGFEEHYSLSDWAFRSVPGFLALHSLTDDSVMMINVQNVARYWLVSTGVFWAMMEARALIEMGQGLSAEDPTGIPEGPMMMEIEEKFYECPECGLIDFAEAFEEV